MPSNAVAQSWISRNYLSFDGLRGTAALMIFVCHLGHLLKPSPVWGCFLWANDLFFVLSGFLITGILYDAPKQAGFFRRFYIRRSLRIFPLFYGFFLLLLLCRCTLPLRADRSIVAFLFYVGNLVVPFLNLERHNPTVITLGTGSAQHAFVNIGMLWSFCVEEQFYLVWPAIVWFVRDRSKLLWICAGDMLITLLLRYALASRDLQAVHPYLIFWSTYTRSDTIIFGAWFALWLRGVELTERQLRVMGAALGVGGFLLFAAPLHFRAAELSLGNTSFQSFGLTGLAVMSSGILLTSLAERSWLATGLRWRPLGWVGTISYGFYFFHSLFVPALDRIITHHPSRAPVLFGLDFVATTMLAWLSFRYFESPFLRMRDRWAPSVAYQEHPAVEAEPEPALNKAA